jgi:hypothetical protein
MTPTPDEICERLLDEEMRLAGQAIDRGCVDSSLSGILAREAADLIQQQQATIERLSALVEESLYHLRLDEAAKAYHERSLTALGKDASDVRAREEDRG